MTRKTKVVYNDEPDYDSEDDYQEYTEYDYAEDDYEDFCMHWNYLVSLQKHNDLGFTCTSDMMYEELCELFTEECQRLLE